MQYDDLISGMKRFGSTEQDICRFGLGVDPQQVRENVILAPWWEPSGLPGLGRAEYLSESASAAVKVWEITYGQHKMTYIKTGIGAPVLLDALLSLGVTPCRRIVFIGSVGSLDCAIRIGDVVLPEYSVCGDGASRYIKEGCLQGHDVFGERVFPDEALLLKAKRIAETVCRAEDVAWHMARAFSIDTIFAQFAHMDEIMQMGCNVIEMETAAAFRGAKLAGIPTVALFCVSDHTIAKQSLVSGRSAEQNAYRKLVRQRVIPKIILQLFHCTQTFVSPEKAKGERK